MEDINGRTIDVGHWLLHKVDNIWRIRRVLKIVGNEIRFESDDMNPAHPGPAPNLPIQYATNTIPTRFLLILDDGPDNLRSIEAAGNFSNARLRRP